MDFPVPNFTSAYRSNRDWSRNLAYNSDTPVTCITSNVTFATSLLNCVGQFLFEVNNSWILVKKNRVVAGHGQLICVKCAELTRISLLRTRTHLILYG